MRSASTSRRSRAGSASSSSMAPRARAGRQRRPDAQDEPADRLARHRRERRQRGHLHRLGLARIDPGLKLRLARRHAAQRRQADGVGASGRIGRRVGGQGQRLGHGRRRRRVRRQASRCRAAPARRGARRRRGPGPARADRRGCRSSRLAPAPRMPAAHALERGRLPPRVARAAASHGRDQAGHATRLARGGDGRPGQREKRRMPVGLPCARDAVGRAAPPPGTPRRGPGPADSAATCIHGSSRCAKNSCCCAALDSAESRPPSVASNWNCARASCFDDGASQRRRPEARPTRPGAARPGATRSPARRPPCRPAPGRPASRRAGRGRRASTARAGGRSGEAPLRATVSSTGAICGGRRSSSSRCAVRRHHRLPCDSASTSAASVAAPRRGAAAGAVGAVGHDPVDAAAIAAQGELRGVLVELAGRPLRVLDAGAVVVDDVQRAVGPDVEVHRPEPRVGGGQELARLRRRGARRRWRPTARSTSRCTRLCTGSATNELRAYSPWNSPPV